MSNYIVEDLMRAVTYIPVITTNISDTIQNIRRSKTATCTINLIIYIHSINISKRDITKYIII